ncbi:hypothetical protein HF521_001895 [Silurus meridionalis]|uniref:Uncharacterized protein n=1 Tax=Silurus meridionalis TaxID=175797 RepID=A0A8T0B7T8_SILME|nr:hypothetical protein HF521_001895 [Silurus meridionalis]
MLSLHQEQRKNKLVTCEAFNNNQSPVLSTVNTEQCSELWTDDPSRESRAATDPSRESRAATDPSRESRAAADPSRDSRAAADPSRDSRAAADPPRARLYATVSPRARLYATVSPGARLFATVSPGARLFATDPSRESRATTDPSQTRLYATVSPRAHLYATDPRRVVVEGLTGHELVLLLLLVEAQHTASAVEAILMLKVSVAALPELQLLPSTFQLSLQSKGKPL